MNTGRNIDTTNQPTEQLRDVYLKQRPSSGPRYVETVNFCTAAVVIHTLCYSLSSMGTPSLPISSEPSVVGIY